VLEHTLSEEEHNQIVQTIEMFEAITQTQPDDYQSLEILKEAYQKVGKHDDCLRISRRLSEAYFNVGSFTLAMQECEVILVKEPNAPDILAMLGEIETRLQASGKAIASGNNGLVNKVDLSGETAGSLIDITSRASQSAKPANLGERGDDHLAKFLIVQQLFAEEEVVASLEAVQHSNKDLTGQALAVSLLDHICKENVTCLEKILSALIDRTKFAYVPLEYYDVDRQIAPMLPEYLTLGRLFVPFDLVSRTMMVACCNPFDSAGREAVQQSLDYTVTWYLARPAAIIKSLQSIYRLETRA
jgi:Type II secretion system (T2SS), protein E, N-terminal domain